MKHRNEKIANVWKDILIKGLPGEGCSIKNHRNTLTLYSDGKVYSYDLLIAEIIDGVHTLYNHTAKGGSYHSQTTSCHVGVLKPYSLKVVNYNV